MTTGFTVGKFYPPHRGHKHLINTGRRQVDRMIVMLCHHPSQTIPAELRNAWLEEIHPDCEIHLVPDELENDSAQWAAFTLKHLGFAPDIVFTSEEYGHRYAELMGSRHVLVDQERLAVPISATTIRQAPLDHLDFLEPCVRAYFIKRVVLIGAESTGKTTLAQKLAKHYRTGWVAEYGREHWEKKIAGLKITDPLPGWTPEEFIHIATEQQQRENLAARSANRVLCCDTNALITGTWFERYMGARSSEVDAIGSRDKADLYLLTEPDFPFVQDGVRDGENIRRWMHERFASQLQAMNVPWIRLGGLLEHRTRAAIARIDRLLAQGC
jgi:HTH-type transcriptional regulator, transcriptional repressor of NAD biosynthesis genes